MDAANKPAFNAPLIATVAVGTPFGIWAIERRLSKPFNVLLSIGTPITGKIVSDAIIPGKCAAPPAPAITTLKFLDAELAKLYNSTWSSVG